MDSEENELFLDEEIGQFCAMIEWNDIQDEQQQAEAQPAAVKQEEAQHLDPVRLRQQQKAQQQACQNAQQQVRSNMPQLPTTPTDASTCWEAVSPVMLLLDPVRLQQQQQQRQAWQVQVQTQGVLSRFQQVDRQQQEVAQSAVVKQEEAQYFDPVNLEQQQQQEPAAWQNDQKQMSSNMPRLPTTPTGASTYWEAVSPVMLPLDPLPLQQQQQQEQAWQVQAQTQDVLQQFQQVQQGAAQAPDFDENQTQQLEPSEQRCEGPPLVLMSDTMLYEGSEVLLNRTSRLRNIQQIVHFLAMTEGKDPQDRNLYHLVQRYENHIFTTALSMEDYSNRIRKKLSKVQKVSRDRQEKTAAKAAAVKQEPQDLDLIRLQQQQQQAWQNSQEQILTQQQDVLPRFQQVQQGAAQATDFDENQTQQLEPSEQRCEGLPIATSPDTLPYEGSELLLNRTSRLRNIQQIVHFLAMTEGKDPQDRNLYRLVQRYENHIFTTALSVEDYSNRIRKKLSKVQKNQAVTKAAAVKQEPQDLDLIRLQQQQPQAWQNSQEQILTQQQDVLPRFQQVERQQQAAAQPASKKQEEAQYLDPVRLQQQQQQQACQNAQQQVSSDMPQLSATPTGSSMPWAAVSPMMIRGVSPGIVMAAGQPYHSVQSQVNTDEVEMRQRSQQANNLRDIYRDNTHHFVQRTSEFLSKLYMTTPDSQKSESALKLEGNMKEGYNALVYMDRCHQSKHTPSAASLHSLEDTLIRVYEASNDLQVAIRDHKKTQRNNTQDSDGGTDGAEDVSSATTTATNTQDTSTATPVKPIREAAWPCQTAQVQEKISQSDAHQESSVGVTPSSGQKPKGKRSKRKARGRSV